MKKKQTLKKLSLQKIRIAALSASRLRDILSPTTGSDQTRISNCPACPPPDTFIIF